MAETIIVEVRKCLACRSCEVACALVHSRSKVLSEAVSESPKPQRMLTVEASGQFAVPMQCRHCEDAPCIKVCPTSALYRHGPNAPVLICREKCIGCKYCLLTCPFGVIDITRDGRAVAKCDLCLERTKVGEEPACVAACPTGAMQFVELTEALAERRRMAARQAGATAAEKSVVYGE
ncbi:MAG: 4Fe-4S binding protein [Phycisphaerales bacterium]|nr:MAG: 4Fe-4S binding protein [Phycisphaerales bacterium]